MMLTRFLILSRLGGVLDADMLSRIGGSGCLHLVYQTETLGVFTSERATLVPLRDEQGLIIGDIFPRHGPARSVRPPETLDHITTFSPSTISRHYWGGYVGLQSANGPVTLMRDPRGMMPCYYAATPEMLIAASDVGLMVDAGLLEPHIAWAELYRYLIASDLPSNRTAIDGVKELLPGTFLYWDGAETVSPFWSPWDHTGAHASLSGQELAERFRRVIDQSVSGWSSTFTQGLVALSGGLDSSIVTTSLALTGRKASCINMVTQARSGDERDYARAVADSAHFPLLEADYDWRDVDLANSVAGHLPKPIGQLHEQAFHAAVMRQVWATGADAVLTGNGGDNVFYNTSSVRPVFDCLTSGPAFLDVFRTMRDVCGVTGANYFQLLSECIRFFPNRKSHYRWQPDRRLLAASIGDELQDEQLSHAWLEGPTNALPGQRAHVAFLLRIQNHLEGYLRGFNVPMLNPLMSQPVVEFALGVPSWRMIEGGRDRTPARRAYASALPPIILNRRRKGSPSGFALEIVQRHTAEIQDRLHNGQLARQGWLDLPAIDRALAQGPAMGTNYVRILGFLDTEAWIAGWERRR